MLSLSRSTMRACVRATLVVITCALAFAGVSAAVSAPAGAAEPTQQVEIVSSGGLRADVMWGSTADYQNVFLWPDNASLSQEFNLLPSGNGYFRIQARHSGKCLMLDWRGGSYVNGTPVIQYNYCTAGYAPAEWTQVTAPQPACPSNRCFSTGQILLKNRATNRCLDIANSKGGTAPAQSRLQQWDCVTSRSQWNFQNQAWTFATPTSAPAPVIH